MNHMTITIELNGARQESEYQIEVDNERRVHVGNHIIPPWMLSGVDMQEEIESCLDDQRYDAQHFQEILETERGLRREGLL